MDKSMDSDQTSNLNNSRINTTNSIEQASPSYKRQTTLDIFTKREANERLQQPSSNENSGVIREMRSNYIQLMNEMNRLDEKIKPLQSITELARKRIPGFSDKVGESNSLDLDFELAGIKGDKRGPDPERVLNSLTAFISNRPLAEKHIEYISNKFIPRDEFNKLKVEVNNDEDRKAAYGELQKLIYYNESKLKEVDSATGALEQDISLINYQLLSKATMGSIDSLQREMEEFINKEQFQRMLIRLESYTSLESFNKHRLVIEREMNVFRHKFDNVPQREDLQKISDSMRTYCQELNKTNSKRGNCAKDKADLLKEIEALRFDLYRTREEQLEQGKTIRELQASVNNKIEREEMDRVIELVKLLPSKEEVSELRYHVAANITRFSKDNASFKTDFQHHLEIIRRYDEVLMYKASKHDIRELSKDLNEKYKTQCEELLKMINKNSVNISKQKTQFEELGYAITEQIEAAVELYTEKRQKEIYAEEDASVPKIQGLTTIRNEGQNGIIKVLSLKADKTEIDRLNETKQSREEAENFMELLVYMNSQIQHAVVILNESLKMNLIKADETKLAKENRSLELMQYVYALSYWTLRFDAKRRIQQDFEINPFEGSVDLGSIDDSEAAVEDQLAGTYAALRQSIATNKEPAQRHYRSPLRQKARISMSKVHRNNLLDYFPSSQDSAYNTYRTSNSPRIEPKVNLMSDMRRSHQQAFRDKIPALKLDNLSIEYLEKQNPNKLSILPGRKKNDHLAILLQRNQMARIGSPPSVSGASSITRNPVLSEQISRKLYHSVGRPGAPMTAAGLTRKAKKAQALGGDTFDAFQSQRVSTAADSLNAAARQMQQRVARNRAAVTIKLGTDGPSPLTGINDPFNKANPLNESLYCDQAMQERQKDAN